ncbi:MAG: hypothetical protein A2086_15985 [Spirochaetes bacterium GWD1_27_9]|nr:MAG: hypothetical protein A2Z98_11400 [Spirochaetes bacterium GWB1_27_13]OHD25117.1 MAG: hypothetical protein A2Y34_12320 [Spirochaetes bacterium GWC1_27_15]OHD36215.1 MAG: hypothetical protein A2086_15985 [Spirochaetes bacterium GWD1_27_9]
MKNIFIVIILLLIVFSCKTKPEIKNDNKNTKVTKIIKDNNKTTKIDTKKEEKIEKYVEFEFLGFNYSFYPEESVLSDGNIYKVNYTLNFNFKNNLAFYCDYKIFDEENNLILEKNNVSVQKDSINENNFFINDKFSDFISHSNLRYYLKVYIDNKTDELVGEFQNQEMPILEDVNIGQIVSKYENKKLILNLFLNIAIKNPKDLKWIRLIHPSNSFYWNIPYENNEQFIRLNASLVDKRHQNYIDNGEYIAQINLGKYGVIQRNIEIIDFFDNKKGANYGLPIANQLDQDKNNIKLDISLIEKINSMELWIYDEKTQKKLGVAKYLTPKNIIAKKELFDMFFDETGNQIKLEYNKKYLYQIYLYSNEYNKINYISASLMEQIVFNSFKFLPF